MLNPKLLSGVSIRLWICINVTQKKGSCTKRFRCSNTVEKSFAIIRYKHGQKVVSVKGWESNSKEEMQHDSNVKVCTEAKMQKTVHVHVEAVYCHQGAVWKTRWSKYWGSEVMIMQIRSLLWIKTDLKTIKTLLPSLSVLLMNSAVALSSVTVSFSARHVPAQPHCTQCSVGVLVNIMQVCLCSLYVGGIPTIPFYIAQQISKVTPAQGHYSGFSASRFNAGLTLITLI